MTAFYHILSGVNAAMNVINIWNAWLFVGKDCFLGS